MKITIQKKTVRSRISALVVLMVSALAGAQTTAKQRQVVVSIPDRKLAVIENGRVLRIFPVSVGAASSPSPTGDFHIVNRVVKPAYYHSGTVVPAGPDNPIGSRWLGLDRKGYGIHGTNEPHSIGKAASHGCIRLRNRDIEQFFAMVRVGDAVHIAKERDGQVAQALGADAPTVAAVQADSRSLNAGGQ